MPGGLEEMQPIFQQVKPEWSNPNQQLTLHLPTKPFIIHVHISKLKTTNLCIQVSDFYSNTFQAIKSVLDLEDMRDRAGIGGPWSDFVDYLKDSFTSEDLKLVLEGNSKSGGAVSARVIAQKFDGMPTISVPLTKLVEAAASEAMANINLELFKKFKNVHESLINEQQQSYQLSKIIAAEQKKNHVIQGQLDASLASQALGTTVSRHEKNNSIQREHDSSSALRAFTHSVPSQEKKDATRREQHASSPSRPKNHSIQREHDFSPASRSFTPSAPPKEKNDAIQRELRASSPSKPQKFRKIADLASSEKQRAKVTPSSKITNLVIPQYRREKVEGILLVDSGDEKD